jgi:hypothetical protein
MSEFYEAFTIGNKNEAAIVTFDVGADRLQTDGMGAKENARGWVEWYKKDANLTPDNIIRTLFSNNINSGILQTRRDFTMGNGLTLYRHEIVDGKKETVLLDLNLYPEIKDFFAVSDINSLLRKATLDLLYFGNSFVEFIYNRGKTIESIHHHDASTVRSGIMKNGFVDKFFVCDEWTKPVLNEKNLSEGNVFIISGYNKKYPDRSFPKAIMHLKGYTPGFPYYPMPDWYGAINWIRLANEIPLWHLSGIQNGYNIRWHIEVPMSYFEQFPKEKREDAKAKLRKEMNDWLAGSENVGKAFVSYVKQNGLEADKWKISSLEAKLNDEAFTILFEQSNMAMTSAHGLHPTLAAVETQGKLSSGSELRNAYLVYMALKTKNTRAILLEPLYEIKKINNWPDEVQFGFEDIEITKLDTNPTGSQTVMS